MAEGAEGTPAAVWYQQLILGVELLPQSCIHKPTTALQEDARKVWSCWIEKFSLMDSEECFESQNATGNTDSKDYTHKSSWEQNSVEELG